MKAIPCIHGKAALRHCKECRRANINKSSRKRYKPEYTRQWYQANRLKQLVACANFRAKKLGVPGEVTIEHYIKLYSMPCTYCGSHAYIEVDHKMIRP
jgi:hypothetical protein